VGHGGHGTCQTTPCSPPDSDAQRSCIGTPRDGANNAPLPGIPTRSDVRVANFEPLGFSSRSCRSTGRLMRSLAPWWGEGQSEASSFFPCGDSTRSSNFSLGFRGGARTGATYTRATPSSSASITKPSWTQTCNEYLLSVTKLTHCTIACKSFAPARACGGRYAWFCKIAQGLCGNDLRRRPLRSDCTTRGSRKH